MEGRFQGERKEGYFTERSEEGYFEEGKKEEKKERRKGNSQKISDQIITNYSLYPNSSHSISWGGGNVSHVNDCELPKDSAASFLLLFTGTAAVDDEDAGSPSVAAATP